MKHLIYVYITIILGCSLPFGHVYAAEKEAGQAAVLAMNTSASLPAVDIRVVKLQNYLESIGSPMASIAYHFIYEADRLDLDWKLIAAIAGNESYFGKHIPYNSYNAWGWAVYTGRSYGAAFTDWKDGVTTVSEGIKYNYINRGAVTIEQIGKKYAADRNWSYKVRHFMEEIDQFVPATKDQLELVS